MILSIPLEEGPHPDVIGCLGIPGDQALLAWNSC